MASRTDRVKLLLTGSTGQVGWYLAQFLDPLLDVVALTRAQLDLSDGERIRAVVRDIRPQLIVNAAAYTAVDKAETEPALAYRINAEAPGILAQEAARLRAVIVHYSTDYVFDGQKSSPYTEEDEPCPLNVYGETKLAGEHAVSASGAPYLIFRTSWLYGPRGQNFLRTILRLAHDREELRIVADQVGAPTSSRMVAEVSARIIAQLLARGQWKTPDAWAGLYHLTTAGQASWFEFAKAILELDPNSKEQLCRSVVGIPSEEYPTLAKRSRYSVLDNARITARFDIHSAHWRAELATIMGLLSRAGIPAETRTDDSAKAI
jgi:dTDP-4-dehydrorhamnose reductase